MGRQENKDDKLARIRDAAATLFAERGFDGTTTSQVAERAGIAKGTLFLYARTKEDLVALVFEDRLGAAVDRAFRTIPEGVSIVDEAVHVFGTFFTVYEPTPELARIVARELMFPPPDARKVRDRVDDGLFEKLAVRIQLRMDRGELAPVAPASFVSAIWFGQYFVALIAWLSGMLPSAAAAQMSLRAALELSIRGLLPTENERKGNEPCTPPRAKPATSTEPTARSARTGSATSKRTASATAATKRSGSR
jgi:TetR/AcrR family transcriptional regulator, cholesterol catabolism regulator